MRKIINKETKSDLISLVAKLYINNHPLEISGDKIAKELGISKPSIFHHFPSLTHLHAMAYLILDNKQKSIFKLQVKNSDFEKKLMIFLELIDENY